MIVDSPAKPYVAILGGAKVSGKIEIIESLLAKADHLLVGGAMANTFLKAQGMGVGKSLAEDDQKEVVLTILRKARERGVQILLPIDYLIATAADASAETKTTESLPLPEDWMAVDIGPKTVEAFAKVVGEARTVFWNGPMGVFEIEKFSLGTVGIARAVAASVSVSIVGGGDSIAAVKKAGVKEGITHLSTGGGASLEFVATGSLPGIVALEG
jgi:phosphoglycerate kinase